MPHLAISSTQNRDRERERERVVLFAVLSPLALAALAYGIVSAHPPLLFLFCSALLGMAFIAILLWGKRRLRRTLFTCIAFGLFYAGRSVLEHLFFARPYDESSMPSAAFVAEMATFVLGCVMAFALSRLRKITPLSSEPSV